MMPFWVEAYFEVRMVMLVSRLAEYATSFCTAMSAWCRGVGVRGGQGRRLVVQGGTHGKSCDVLDDGGRDASIARPGGITEEKARSMLAQVGVAIVSWIGLLCYLGTIECWWRQVKQMEMDTYTALAISST